MIKFKDLPLNTIFKLHGAYNSECIVKKIRKTASGKNDNVRIIKGVFKFMSFDVYDGLIIKPNVEISEADIISGFEI